MYQKVSEELLDFINESPSCYHAVKNLAGMLEDYKELKEDKDWKLKAGGKYYVIRKDSSIIAFQVPKKSLKEVYITSSHSDSPTFKIKSNAAMVSEKHYTRLNTEKYGGMNMSSWLDRPLSIAGRVIIKENGEFVTRLFDVAQDLLLIPSVAIHMNRELNNGVKYDAQVDTIPLFGDENASEKLEELIATAAGVNKEEVLGTDCFLYIRNKGTVWGADSEFISSRALDDLQCAYATMRGLLATKGTEHKLNLCCVFDNEEVGSLTGQGADSTFLEDTLARIAGAMNYSQDDMLKAIAKGYMISADNAHAVHPNHPEYADPTNRPYMNGGIVIKYNAAQKYTTDAYSEAMFRDVCKRAEVPVQTFTNKSNMAGGSTLGNIANRHISIKTVDIGLPQLAMHSAYETAGVKDTAYLIDAVKEFYS